MTARRLERTTTAENETHPGFIAALDQSGGSTPNALRLYGIKEGAWSNEEEMFALVHQMRTRLYDQLQLHRRADSPPSCSRTPWTGTSRAADRGLSVERETGGALSESGPGPGR